MSQTTFLDKLAAVILDEYVANNTATTIVLPNRRARVFLLEALKQRTTKPFFAPKIISIEELIQEIAGLQFIDPIVLLFEFYDVYQSITETKHQQSFEQYANWAKTLLQDFNEIDRYLLEPDKILKYLDDINEIEHWSVDIENRTPLIENYLNFWKLLPNYYHNLYKHLLQKKTGYQGLVYREAVKRLPDFTKNNQDVLVFAGFNALNAAEERLIKELLNLGQARVFWDADLAFLEDPYHDAGFFLQKYKAHWPYYRTHEFEWLGTDFATAKNITVIGTPKLIGQAKITGEIVADLVANPEYTAQRTAVVLADENLLLPVLNSLPSSVGALNITMGYSAKNNPVQLLLGKLFKLHTAALRRNPGSYVLYYKDLLDLLTHPLVAPFAKTLGVVREIQAQNYTFITHKRLYELQQMNNPFFCMLFDKWDAGPLAVLERLAALLLEIKAQLAQVPTPDKVAGAFVFALYKVINKLRTHYSNHNQTNDLQTLYAIYKQVVELAEVSFEGEPLNGLQIMGVLESRVLDFDTVIVTSVNEGKFPAGKSQNSFIPYDVKLLYGLPTFKEKDAIYTYHFYHLLQRAKKVYLLYNVESEGLEAGEKSRFITQLEVEKQPHHELRMEVRQPETPSQAAAPLEVAKSDAVMLRLHEICAAGFSPSALTSYIRNPIDFYFQKILRIREVEEVEENIALNTLGTIIHGTLEMLYRPLIGKILLVSDIKHCLTLVDAEVRNQFKIVYREGEISRGRNLLAFEVAKRNVINFLNLELESLEAKDEIQILYLEERFERVLENVALPVPVKIGGSVDRIERRNGVIRITDYKTGKVEQRSLQLSTWDGLTLEIKNDKIIQLLAYALLYEEKAGGTAMEVGILSFKNLRAGFMPFRFKNQDKSMQQTITPELIEAYKRELVVLLNEILDPEVPFKEVI